MARTRHLVAFAFWLLISSLAPGCVGVPHNGDLAVVQVNSNAPRAGNVYLLRGWIGIFSRGIDDLGDKLNADGVRAKVFQADQWAELADTIAARYAKPAGVREPLVLVGHSYGADNVVRIARSLSQSRITVDLLVTLDPVTPPSVPTNVTATYNLYQSNGLADALPFLRGIPLSPESQAVKVENLNLRTDRKDLLAEGHVDHFNIEKKDLVHRDIIRRVERVCLPREAWATLRGTSPAPVFPDATFASASGGPSMSTPGTTARLQLPTSPAGSPAPSQSKLAVAPEPHSGAVMASGRTPAASGTGGRGTETPASAPATPSGSAGTGHSPGIPAQGKQLPANVYGRGSPDPWAKGSK